MPKLNLTAGLPPDVIVEKEDPRCQELLKDPSTGEPFAYWKLILWCTSVVKVGEGDITLCRLVVPEKHGIDRFA